MGKADNPVIPDSVSRPNPLLWINRFVLMKNPAERPFFRDVPLKCGLNIVSVERASEKDAVDLTEVGLGHGVGKTSFCRLIRYCLDEATFGRKAFRSRVAQVLPEARVGLEVYLRGVRWSVSRSLSNSNDSMASEGASLEELLEGKSASSSYQAYQQALLAIGNEAIPRVESDLAQASERLWPHLLAWCARDQETRYQALHEWRSRRSESGTPAFDKPKVDAIRFMARVLGLCSPNDIALQNELEVLERTLSDADQQVREIERRYDTEIARLRRDLALQGVTDATEASFVSLNLFTTSLQSCVDSRGQFIDDELTTLHQRLQALGREAAVIGASINETRQVVGERETVIRVTQAGNAALEEDVRSLQNDLEELRRIGSWLCKYGQVTIGECNYVRNRIEDSERILAESRRTTARDTAQRDQTVAAQREVIGRVSVRVATLEQQQRTLLSEQEEVARRIGECRFARARLDSTWAECQTWHRRRNGKEVDPEAENARAEQARLRLRFSELQEAIAAERTTLAERLRRLSRLFGSVVRHVLSDEYDGRVTFKNDELDFGIAHGSLVAGEAIETLCILLADLTAMVGAAQGIGSHPGWLLHDSPREADLGITVYHRLLQSVAAFSPTGTRPPFQYIVTTTTPPPEQLQREHGRLPLHNRDETGLLFGRDLGREVTLL